MQSSTSILRQQTQFELLITRKISNMQLEIDSLKEQINGLKINTQENIFYVFYRLNIGRFIKGYHICRVGVSSKKFSKFTFSSSYNSYRYIESNQQINKTAQKTQEAVTGSVTGCI